MITLFVLICVGMLIGLTLPSAYVILRMDPKRYVPTPYGMRLLATCGLLACLIGCVLAALLIILNQLTPR